MGQILRITFENTDYNYQLLNSAPVSKETAEIQISLDGESYTLTCQQGQWLPTAHYNTKVTGLLIAIGRALASRYRI